MALTISGSFSEFGPLWVVRFTSISRSFYRYQPFGEPLSAVHFTAISRSANRYYLFGGVLTAVLCPLIVCS